MVDEAKQFEEEDRLHRAKVAAKNGLENYAYSVKNTLDGDVGKKLADDQKEAARKAAEDALAWIDENPLATTEQLEARQKDTEAVVSPIFASVYQQQAPQGQDQQPMNSDGGAGPKVETVD